MKVLIVQGTPAENPLSGELTVICNEQHELSKYHEVRAEVIFPKSKDNASLIYTGMSFLWSHKNYKVILKLINDFKPDVIHFHTISPYLSISVLAAAKKCKIPVVQTLHNMRWLCVEGGFFRDGQFCDECVQSFGLRGVIKGCSKGKVASSLLFIVNVFSRYTKFLFMSVDKFVAVSDYVRDQHVISGFPSDKIEVNNNGVDLQVLKNKGYEKLWSARRGVAFAGRLSAAKGASVLRYLMTKTDQPIHIIGNGPELQPLRQYCQKNHLRHVKFWGKLPHHKTLDLLGSVVCTIVPSQCGETFSLVAAESMALGTPVVASNVGGLADLIKQSGGGLLFEPKDFDGAVEAVTKLLEFFPKAEQIGGIGKKYVLEHLSLKERTEQLQKIYESVI